MKIKGVATGKTRGMLKGDPIEFSPVEKAPLAVKDAIKAQSSGDLVKWAEEVTVTSQHHTPMETKKEGKFQNNAYEARGMVAVRTHNTKTDRYFPAEKFEFHIEFKDCLDENGFPDIDITKFDMK